MSDDKTKAAAGAKPMQALLMLPAIVVVIVAFIALNGVAGTSEFYAGFFFLLYWTSFEHSKMSALPSSALGCAFGLAMGFGLYWLTHTYGQSGGLIFMAVLLPVIFCLMIGFLPLIINNAAMLTLTVSTIPYVQQHADFGKMFLSLGLGVAFFGLLFWGVGKLTAPKAAPVAAAE